jgi:putative ABC transport system permease protein
MFKNYFIVAIRNLWKRKVFSFINIAGLAIGISAALVIFLLVNYHFSFDQFQKNKDRLYRVVTDFNFSGEEYHNSGVVFPMAKAAQKEITGIDRVVPFYTWGAQPKISIPVSGKAIPQMFKQQKGVIYADSNFTSMMGYRWLAGSSANALTGPFQVVLNAEAAALYFPKKNATELLGKEIYFDDTIRTTITGVVAKIDNNTDFNFKTIVSLVTLDQASFQPEDRNTWSNTNSSSQLFLQLSAGTTKSAIEKSIRSVFKKYHKPEPGDHTSQTYTLQPLSDFHFNTTYGGYDLPTGSKPTLYGLLAVAAFLLLLGCINFINLTTAHSADRIKEIGIRKTLGSSRKQLMLLLLNETFLLTLFATALSILLGPLILKAFAGFVPEGLSFNIAEQPEMLLFLFGLMVLVTILSGVYPAVVLSGHQPIEIIKNQTTVTGGKTRSSWLRKSLTISQFVIAQVFIMGTILVSKQISFSLNKAQGFNKEAILSFETNYYDTSRTNKYFLMQKIQAIPEVALASLCTSAPSSNRTWSGTMKYKDGKKEIETDVQQKYGDSNYLQLYGIQLLAGENIKNSKEVSGFLINETFAHMLGFQQPQNALGKALEWSDKQIPIVGVVADFNQRSLREPIRALAIGSWANPQRTISVKLKPKSAAMPSWSIAVKKIEAAFKEVYPQEDFEYNFFDEEIAKYYTAEQNIATLLTWATSLAILISCLGLFGLVIFTTSKRTKEIGIRKVLGASITQITRLLSTEFIRLVLIAIVIATPIAFLCMQKWLQNFAFQTKISWWIFLLGGCSMLLMALFTLAFQTIKAASANPVDSLRSE